jgi:hypothetical protein
MDLKGYYQKIRELERGFTDAYPVVVSQQTPDGGVAGVKTEVPGHLAAKMIAEGQARLASEQEAREFQDQKAEAKRIAEQLGPSKHMQLTVVSQRDPRTRRGSKPAAKS